MDLPGNTTDGIPKVTSKGGVVLADAPLMTTVIG